MRKAIGGSMAIHAVILEFARIRLVESNRESSGQHGLCQRHRKSLVAIEQNSNLPGATASFPGRREAVHGQDRGHRTARTKLLDLFSDRLVVRFVIERN